MAKNSHKLVRRIAKYLVKRQCTLSVAESVTAGRIQVLLTAASGSSDFFEGGVTAYSLDQKTRILGVEPSHAAQVNCVSQQVSEQMAAGAGALFRTHFALGITGYAEPDESNGIKIPQAHVSIWVADASSDGEAKGRLLAHKLIRAKRKRRKAQDLLAHKALALLLATIRSME